jgi:hypothetical protein
MPFSARLAAFSVPTPVNPALHRALAPTGCGSKTSRDGQSALDLPWRSLTGPFHLTFCRCSPRRSQPLTGLARSLQDGSGALQTFPPSSHFFCAKLPHSAFFLSITWTLPHFDRFSFILPLPSASQSSIISTAPCLLAIIYPIVVALRDLTISSRAHCPVLTKTGLRILNQLYHY